MMTNSTQSTTTRASNWPVCTRPCPGPSPSSDSGPLPLAALTAWAHTAAQRSESVVAVGAAAAVVAQAHDPDDERLLNELATGKDAGLEASLELLWREERSR